MIESFLILEFLHKLPGDLLVQDFPHSQWDDDGVVGFEKAVNLAQGVLGVIEGDEETLVAIAAAHGGLEGVNVWTAHLVLLLHLNEIPVFSEL
jgi:hypothetical protein